MESRFVALALAATLVLTACSSSPRTTGTAAPTLPAEQPAETASSSTTTSDAAPPATVDSAEPAIEASAEAQSVTSSCPGDGDNMLVGRTDITPSGNRLAPGSIDLLNVSVNATELPAPPTWIVPFFASDDPCRPHWYVTLANGSAVRVDPQGGITDAGPATTPPLSTLDSVTSAYDALDQFDNPLPDSRVVSFGPWIAALVDPTDRYGHGVLGDRIEAAAVQVIDTVSGERNLILIDAPSVIEGISPMLIDVDQNDDDVPEVLVTLSNGDDGAWLALYDLDGTLRAQSDPIGQGNRWRNQLGAAWTAPDGTLEIVDVRTPHLAGIVEFFRLNGNQLELTASTDGYTNHTIGSRNLDLGILVDADTDKLPEVVLPTRDLGSLVIIDRVDDAAVESGRIELDGSLATNIASQWIVGQAWLAIGTEDGRLLVFGDQ